MSKFKNFIDSFDSQWKSGIAIALAIILLFSFGYLGGIAKGTGNAIKASVDQQNTSANSNTPAASNTTAAPSAAPSASATAAPSAAESSSQANESKPSEAQSNTNPQASESKPAAEDPNANATPGNTPAPAPNSSSMSKADIVKLYNESANKIKTSAKKVTRNYKDQAHNEEYTVLPSLLNSIGKSLISQFLKKDETPVDFEGTQAIIENYPINGESYVSKLTEADLADATVQDDGTYYNITLKFNESTDPTDSGVASAFNVIKSEQITEAVPAGLVQSASARYYDNVITCKIEKATGNMVWANYKQPVVLSVVAKVVGQSLDASVGMTFEDDFTIVY